MDERYDHRKVEQKWQKRWEESQAFRATEDKNKKKTYLLIEFPYPSGEGLHVGHIRSWTALDIVARKRRMQGESVLYPIGWDAFGLPAENYALKTGIHPRISTKENTDNFRRQIKCLGLSFDWAREINTTDPKYYRWTQWIFLQLFKKGLAYKAKTTINWCPLDKIGLANEEVVDGACERCGTPVQKREKEQWMLAITKYAKRLFDDLDSVDYIERAKVQQRNWIGPSEGAELDFAVAGGEEKIKVFTTRPDTLFGATYMVLAPEHPLVGALAARSQNKEEIEKYVAQAKKKTEIERSTEGMEKTGVEIKGIQAINPANKEKIPLFVADYVLFGYGTGAIMAVPAHDERDFAFAQKFKLPVRQVVEPVYTQSVEPGKVVENLPFEHRNAVIAIVKHWAENKYLALRWKGVAWGTFITGGIEGGQSAEEAAKAEIAEETGYETPKLVKDFGVIHGRFYHVPKKVNRFAHSRALYFELQNENRKEISKEEQERHEVLWLTKEELRKFLTPDSHFRALDLLEGKEVYAGEGILTNSNEFNGLQSDEARKKITLSVSGEWKTAYKLRDWVFSRQRYWGEPIPMIFCEKDGWVGVPEEELPVELPQVEKYQPSDSGESPLANITQWVNTTCPKCGGPARRETDVMPNWAGSSWYYLRYTDPQDERGLASREKLEYWTPVDWYNGGMEHTTLHLLYSRFWHKFLFDIGVAPSAEPYKKRTSHGLILAEGGEKMSKSKGNVINPDSLVERYGADALRLYEMFIGPFEQAVVWNSTAISGTVRFLERVWRLKVSESSPEDFSMDQIIKKITDDIEALKFNTAVSSLMIALKELEDLKGISKEAYKTFLMLLHPFAPHITSELGEAHGVTFGQWPHYDAGKLVKDVVTIAVQINGKTRTSVEISTQAKEAEVLSLVRADSTVKKWLDKGKEEKAIYVPGKVVNFVVR